MPNTRDRKLFFFHNPKAGGTSVARALESMFLDVERCPLIENSERDHDSRQGDYAEFRGYPYYGGHYGNDIFRAVASDSHCAVTNFRDPAERLLSLYNYYRLDVTVPDDPSQFDNYHAVIFAQQADFHQFVSSQEPRIEIHTRNHHARQLTNSGWVWERTVDPTDAIAMLERMPWFYICEYSEQSMRWGRKIFGESFPSIQRENVTSREKNERIALINIEPSTRRLIYKKNALDEMLRVHAMRRLLREA